MDFIKNLFQGANAQNVGKEAGLLLSAIPLLANFKQVGMVGEAKIVLKTIFPNVQEEAKLEALLDAGVALEIAGVAFWHAWQEVQPFFHPAAPAAPHQP